MSPLFTLPFWILLQIDNVTGVIDTHKNQRDVTWNKMANFDDYAIKNVWEY